MLTWSSIAEHVQAGKLVALATTSANRLSYLPDVPTLRELGHKDFVALTWFSLSGPAKMPKPLVDKINAAMIQAASRPEIKARVTRDAVEAAPMTSEELGRFTQQEIDRWVPLVKRVLARQKK